MDPGATGVLILGLGSGTKQLHRFTTECNKTYDTVVLFGAATDTYDTEGKVVSRKSFNNVTQKAVEDALDAFRGKIMQQPPIFSALRVQGKRLYEYAREGKEVPVEIQKRPVEVLSMEMIEWMDGGTHPWHWPESEVDVVEKKVIDKVLHLEGDGEPAGTDEISELVGTKRKREDESDAVKLTHHKHSKSDTKPDTVDISREESPTKTSIQPDSQKPTEPDPENTANVVDSLGSEAVPENQIHPAPRENCPAPACRLRMTVTSGFYVRSLCHDLGIAVGSLGTMANLVRQRQGEFEVGINTLSYEDLKQGESVWGPKVQEMLERGRSED